MAFRFASLTGAAAVIAGVLVAAILVNRFAPKKRRHIRSSAILGVLYLLAFATAYVLRLLHQPAAADVAGQVAELCGTISVVNVSALLLFDLGLPALGMN